jgi:formylglycine-generating enzyme required for sulfatase activity
MKTGILKSFALLLALCAGVLNAQTLSLDQAIQAACKGIEAEMKSGATIAILNVASSSEAFSAYTVDELTVNLWQGKKVTVVDRAQLDLIRKEMNFQMSGEVSDESMQSIGKMLGAQAVVSGSFTEMGDFNYRFVVRTLNVQTAAIEAVYRTNVLNDSNVSFLITGRRTGVTPPAAQPPAPTPIRPPAQPVTPAAPPQRPVPADMVRIPGGTFTMGSPASEVSRSDNEVQHTVTVSPFLMGKYEVTQKEWRDVMGTNIRQQRDKAGTSNSLYGEGENYPMYYVNWYEAVEYCNKRSAQEGLTPAYTISGTTVTRNRSASDQRSAGYRLPTEAEWEYACRAGTTTPFNTGNNITTSQANYNGNYPYNNNAKEIYRQTTAPVGTFPSNAWGLFDMHGNVCEWCWDWGWYGAYSSGAQTDPVGASSGVYRVSRGGSWASFGQILRSACRDGYTLSNRRSNLGFRVCRNAG